eukprot:scaffold31_cov263-Pinguiococcus_pyrenoidosus.AAC.52
MRIAEVEVCDKRSLRLGKLFPELLLHLLEAILLVCRQVDEAALVDVACPQRHEHCLILAKMLFSARRPPYPATGPVYGQHCKTGHHALAAQHQGVVHAGCGELPHQDVGVRVVTNLRGGVDLASRRHGNIKCISAGTRVMKHPDAQLLTFAR